MIQAFLGYFVDTIPYFIYSWIFYITPFVVAKVFAWDNKFLLRDGVLIILFSMLCALFISVPYYILAYFMRLRQTASFFIVLMRIVPVILMFAYFWKLKSYTMKNAIILAIFANATRFIASLSATFIFTTFFDMHFYFDIQNALISIYWAASQTIISVIVASLAVIATENFRKKVKENSTMSTALMLGALISWGTYEIIVLAIFFMQGGITYLWMSLFLFIFVCITVACFIVYSKSLLAKLLIQRQEAERMNLQFYMEEIEEQQIAIRKFKHDQQNLFTTMDIFIQEKDWDGMSQFYTKVRDAFATIAEDESVLEGLDKVKVREVKNILIAKILTAQNLGLDIKVEIEDEIDEVSVEPVALVRMLGIILDNAIEEVQHSGAGQLLISCNKIEGAVNFVVQNSCRADLPPIQQLRQPEFSTKGKGRGFGLSSLYEQVDALPNATLHTDVGDGNFTQTLIIGSAI